MTVNVRTERIEGYCDKHKKETHVIVGVIEEGELMVAKWSCGCKSKNKEYEIPFGRGIRI